MAFFAGLCSFALLFAAIGYLFHIPALQTFTTDIRISVSVMFLLVGFSHFAKPRQLSYMIEGMLPWPLFWIYLTGAAEILFGAGLLFPSTRLYAAWGLIILLVGMFPANIRVAVKKLPAPGGLPSKPWYTWSRLLFQPVYIAIIAAVSN
ncbi:MauE/DoxX family redox-associated membrane protein [Chitinophaga sp. 212800010-3]|uniref:DoxX family protein n=1 Tax=unclassified Chitinophaga TaxID=2619133 RepID=UPI002DEE4476|nr:DoxX family membrane protein [Chitinophaga sp. 212800010-3]